MCILIIPSTGVAVMLVWWLFGQIVSIDKLVVNAVNPLQPEKHTSFLGRQFFPYIEVTRSAA